MDVYSSLGNPRLMDYQRIGKVNRLCRIGLSLAGVGAGLPGRSSTLLHKRPANAVYKAGTIMNFAFAGTLGGVAVHNYGVRRST